MHQFLLWLVIYLHFKFTNISISHLGMEGNRAIPSGAQKLVLALCSVVTPGGAQEPCVLPGIKQDQLCTNSLT